MFCHSYNLNNNRYEQQTIEQKVTLYQNILMQVYIADRNDHSPVFEDKSYVFSVAENSRPGLVLGSVRARDDDKGKNGEIEYRLRTTIKKFSIEPTSGKIFECCNNLKVTYHIL